MAKKESKSTQAATAPGGQVVTLKVPTCKTDGYVGDRIDVRMTRREAIACRRLFDGLRSEHVILPTGRHVDRSPDAVRWILNRIYHEIYGDADPFTL